MELTDLWPGFPEKSLHLFSGNPGGAFFSLASCHRSGERLWLLLWAFLLLSVRDVAVFPCLPRVQQRWSRSRWIRSLAARGTWSSAKASALRSHTKWRTCCTCSSEAVWPCACGSARSAWSLSLLPADVVTRLEMNTSSSARHRLHVPAKLAGNFLPSHSFFLLSHPYFPFRPALQLFYSRSIAFVRVHVSVR